MAGQVCAVVKICIWIQKVPSSNLSQNAGRTLWDFRVFSELGESICEPNIDAWTCQIRTSFVKNRKLFLNINYLKILVHIYVGFTLFIGHEDP